MFRLLTFVACTLSLALAQYQPQYQQQRYQQQQYQQQQRPQYQQQQAQYQQQQQQQPQYQQVQYQPAEPLPTAAQYPAGVDAQSCPNYPDCTNPLLALQAVAKASDPRYQAEVSPRAPQPLHQSQHEYSPEVQQKLDRGEYIGDGDYHGEGLDEALAPETAVRSGYAAQQPSAGQYPAQQAASQYSAQPGAVQYPAQIAASQYAARPVPVQYPAQVAASQYAAQPGAVQYPTQLAASQYPAQRAASQYAAQQYSSSPRYITAPQARYYQPQARASLFSPQYQAAPVHEGSSYSPVANNALASASEPVAAVQLPAGIDASSCPNYPFCQS